MKLVHNRFYTAVGVRCVCLNCRGSVQNRLHGRVWACMLGMYARRVCPFVFVLCFTPWILTLSLMPLIIHCYRRVLCLNFDHYYSSCYFKVVWSFLLFLCCLCFQIPRIKTLAQKRHRTNEARSSIGIGIRADHRPIYDKFRNSKAIQPNIVIDWDVLERFNIRQAVEELLHDPTWLRLFSIEEKVYSDLTLPFLATFTI